MHALAMINPGCAIAPPVATSPRLNPPAEKPSVPAGQAIGLRNIFRSHRWSMLLTYALFNGENLLKLAQPFVLGLAINDLLGGSYRGLAIFVVQHLAHMVISRSRQRYDTRVFNRVYTGMATNLITGQRASNVEVTRVAARSALARHYVDFFELYVPLVIKSGYAVVGALVMLGWYDWVLVPLCLALLAPAALLNMAYSRQTFVLNRKLHDELEREVEVIERNQPDEVRGHFDVVGLWRVHLSDAEAKNFCLMEVFVLAAMAAVLVRFCMAHPGTTANAPGDIFAVFRYVMVFLAGLDSVPRVVAQWSRLRDVGLRVRG